MIHAYDGNTFELIGSFGISCAAGKSVDPQVERMYAGGFIDIGRDSLLYYVQRSPQEVRIYLPSGELLATHPTRRHQLGPPPEPEVYDGEGQRRFTLQRESPFFVLGRDGVERIFVWENRDDVPVVVRYRLHLDD